MRTLIIAALLAAFAFSADAQTLYRCVQKDKPTSFQNSPCPDAAKTASALAYMPERNVPAYRPTPEPVMRHRQQATSVRMRNIPRASSPTACEAAKQHRDSVLGTNNQGGNVDVRRVLNDAVARACN